jgi:hypothetical protein
MGIGKEKTGAIDADMDDDRSPMPAPATKTSFRGLEAPVKTAVDKLPLLPAFLKVRAITASPLRGTANPLRVAHGSSLLSFAFRLR